MDVRWLEHSGTARSTRWYARTRCLEHHPYTGYVPVLTPGRAQPACVAPACQAAAGEESFVPQQSLQQGFISSLPSIQQGEASIAAAAAVTPLQALRSSNKTRALPSTQSAGSTLAPKQRINLSDHGICTSCKGSGQVTCKACSGTGMMAKGGWNKKNPIPKDVINSKWTAMVETSGWRHFRVIQQRKNGNLVFMLMQASCDPRAQLWVNKDALRDRSRWAAGWLLMSEMPNRKSPGGGEAGDADTAAGEAAHAGGEPQAVSQVQQSAKPCKACAGTGMIICKTCDASGVVPINL